MWLSCLPPYFPTKFSYYILDSVITKNYNQNLKPQNPPCGEPPHTPKPQNPIMALSYSGDAKPASNPRKTRVKPTQNLRQTYAKPASNLRKTCVKPSKGAEGRPTARPSAFLRFS